MLIRRLPMRVCSSSEMLVSHLNFVSQCPLVLHEHKSFVMSIPCPVSLTIRCFRSSTSPNPSKVAVTELAQAPSSLSGAATRMSRFARTEAQEALFDYLRGTRSFQVMDAEHISKNSPCFLRKLLSKVEHDQDIARSLSRFFRFNPINEFEPFFESLGLFPSEFSLLLPRDLMFLSDDRSMLENFHVLRDYGIPRTRIGKIYKEAREVFGYKVGVLGSKLRGYEELGLSKSTVIKLSTHMAYEKITEEAVYLCTGNPLPKDIEQICYWLLNETFAASFGRIFEIKTKKGLALVDIVKEVTMFVFKIKMPSDVRVQLISDMADIEYRLSFGGSDRLQLGSLISSFTRARSALVAAAK